MRIAKQLLLLAGVCLAACSPPASSGPQEVSYQTPVLPDRTAAELALMAQNQQFESALHPLTDNVWLSVGHGVANVGIIEGENGLIIIDATESPASAERVLEAIRAYTDKPVSALIYTHAHVDHMGGASVFAQAGEDVAIWAHAPFGTENAGPQIPGAWRARGARQAGFQLPMDQRINNGVAPARPAMGFGQGILPPTDTFEGERLALEIEGVRLDLVHAPGETDDQIYVWLPEDRVVFAGDNFYRSFPNLYAIRGTRYRDVNAWANALDAMLAEGPLHLAPGHTRPFSGEAEVADVLANYRDAIRFVHDETIAGMNQGLGPDELATTLVLPEHLRDLDYLQEFYGRVEWGVRAVFTAELGWFDGAALNLSPMSKAERAERVVALAGGAQAALGAASEAMDAGDAQWAGELAEAVLILDPANDLARTILADALTVLGRTMPTATGRNYYLSQAQAVRNGPGQTQ